MTLFDKLKKNRVFALLIFVFAIVIMFKAFIFGRDLSANNGNFGGATSAEIVDFIFLSLLCVIWALASETRRLDRQLAWLTDATNRNFELLKRKGNGQVLADKAPNDIVANQARWPWGNHHTAALGHLEAAARTLWTLYDPNDFSTAPTNEMVAEWLQSKRGVSRERARAIASMLRPDDLPTGPRR